jgi:hypothetical protein
MKTFGLFIIIGNFFAKAKQFSPSEMATEQFLDEVSM